MRGARHPAAALGSAVHGTVESVYRSWGLGQTILDPITIFQAKFKEELGDTEVDHSYYNKLLIDGIKMVGDYNWSLRTPVELEQQFLIPFPNEVRPVCLIKGYLDHIFDWGFVDLKTNGKKPTATELDNDLQFIIYAWAYERLYGRVPEKCIWHHLRTHQDIEADVVGKIAILEPIIHTLLTDIEYKKTTGFHCRWCPHKVDCLGAL